MSDDIVVSGGGTIAVASDELLWHAEQLRVLTHEMREVTARLTVIDARVDGRSLARTSAVAEARRAEDAIDSALRQFERVGIAARELSRSLLASAEAYGAAEYVATAASELVAGAIADILGMFFPLVLLWLFPALSTGVTGLLIGSLLAPGGPKALIDRLPTMLKENSALVSNPVVVALMRMAVSNSDDVVNGRLGIPPQISALLGDRGLGLTGVDTTAALLTGLGGVGLLAESPVRASRAGEVPVSQPPTGMADRFDRVPEPESNGGSQVRIERYSVEGEPDRFEVYIAGTVDFSPVAGDEPWDMTSNVAGVAGLPAGSYRAVVEALAEAGITADSPVQFTGYSQGGLVATMLAASGDYNTQGLVTFGAPAGNVELPGTFPAIAVEHMEDIVPATGGDQVNPSVIVARRELYADAEVPTDMIFPAHQRTSYADTAALLDEQHSPALTSAMQSITSFAAGATAAEGTMYSAVRVAPVVASGGAGV